MLQTFSCYGWHSLAFLKVRTDLWLCGKSCDHAGLATPPPSVPPVEIVDQLTVNGSVPLEYYYVDDSNKGKGEKNSTTIKCQSKMPVYMLCLSGVYMCRYSLQVLLWRHWCFDRPSSALCQEGAVNAIAPCPCRYLHIDDMAHTTYWHMACPCTGQIPRCWSVCCKFRMNYGLRHIQQSMYMYRLSLALHRRGMKPCC